jgi:hypothetical protein
MNWIKRTCKRVIGVGALIILAACIALPIVHGLMQLAAPPASAQDGINTGASRTTRDEIFRTVHISPSKSSPSTNAFIVRDKTGTNWLAIQPTNCQIAQNIGGLQYTGVTGTLTMTGGLGVLNGASNLVFRNGLLMGGP